MSDTSQEDVLSWLATTTNAERFEFIRKVLNCCPLEENKGLLRLVENTRKRSSAFSGSNSPSHMTLFIELRVSIHFFPFCTLSSISSTFFHCPLKWEWTVEVLILCAYLCMEYFVRALSSLRERDAFK